MMHKCILITTVVLLSLFHGGCREYTETYYRYDYNNITNIQWDASMPVPLEQSEAITIATNYLAGVPESSHGQWTVRSVKLEESPGIGWVYQLYFDDKTKLSQPPSTFVKVLLSGDVLQPTVKETRTRKRLSLF